MEVVIYYFFQVLYAKDLDQRSITFEKAIAMGEEYQMKSKVCFIFCFNADDFPCLCSSVCRFWKSVEIKNFIQLFCMVYML